MNRSFSKARRHRMRVAWLVWCVAAIFVLFQFFLQLSSGVILAVVMKSLSLNSFSVGVLMSSYYYIYVILQAPAGALIDRYGPRAILAGGAFFVGLGCVIFSSASLYSLAIFGRILMGAGASFAFVGCMHVVSVWFPSRRFALMTAIVETAGMIGAIGGNFWLADFIHRFSWQTCLFSAGIFAFGLSLFLYLFVKNSPKKKFLPDATILPPRFWQSISSLILQPVLWINGLYSGALFGVVTVFIAMWAIPFFQCAYGLHLRAASMLASMLYLGIAIGGPLLGFLDARTNWRRQLMMFNALFTAACLLCVIYAIGLPLWVIASVLFFAGIGTSSYVLSFAYVNTVAKPGNRSAAIGFTNMLCVVIAPIFQPVVGFFLTYFNHAAVNLSAVSHFQWAVTVVPLMLLCASVSVLWLPE